MNVNKYLKNKETEYSLELLIVLIDGIKKLKDLKTEHLEELVRELNILKDSILNYEKSMGSMVTSNVFDLKEDRHLNRERLSRIETNMGYFEWEISYISNLINDFEDLQENLQKNYEKIDDIKEYEKIRKEEQTKLIIREVISQINREIDIIDSVEYELLKINSFGIYDYENVAKSIQFDTNALLTDMLIEELKRVSDIEIGSEDIREVDIFDRRFSDFVLNNRVSYSISKIKHIKSKLEDMKEILIKNLNKKEI